MTQVTDILRHVGLAVFVGLTIACMRQWRARSLPPIRWATIAFGSLAAIGIIGLVMRLAGALGYVGFLIKVLLAVVILFPYFLYRFAIAFKRPGPAVIAVARFVTLASVVYTFALPHFPTPGKPFPVWWNGYRVVVLVQWTVLFCIVAAQLWGGSKEHTTVPRRRMRTLAIATLGMNVAVLLSGAASTPRSQALMLANQILSLGSSVLFFIGLAPPEWLVHVWRRPEGAAFQGAMRDLFGATTQAEVSAILLPHVVAVMGARGAALVSPAGTVLGTHGSTDTSEEIVRLATAEHPPETAAVHRVPFRTGCLLMWTSPYAPFFGRTELAIMEWWGVFVDLAMDRGIGEEQQRTFIANAAHELRTPLTAILGLSTTLAHGRPILTATQVQECVEALERQGTRAVALIRNLLDLAQLDGGRLKASLAPVSLQVAVERALEAAPPPKGTTVAVEIGRDAVAAADPDRLEQILVNLLQNAYRYGGSDVRIETREDSDGIVLVVADGGPGVPEELVPHLFETFARAPDACSPGSGLGLALSKRLAEAIAGTIWYAPASPHGARFNVRLKKSA